MCLNPMVMDLSTERTNSGKLKYKFAMSLDAWLDIHHSMPDSIFHKIVPCKQCIECRLSYARSWALRLMLEKESYDDDSCYFLTLTYSPDKISTIQRFYPDPDTGEAMPSLSLNKSDFQGFMKRLRRRLDYSSGDKIRFYAAGEYGESTHRPHYHCIIFGLKIPDLRFYKKSALGHIYYNSEWLNEIWGFGYVVVGRVTMDSAGYVARYVTKKYTGDYKQFYEIFNIDPEFSLCSRRPGIAREYYEQHKDEIYQFDRVNLSAAERGYSFKPPPYYDRLFEDSDPILMESIKASRSRSQNFLEKLKQRVTNLSISEQYQARRRLYDKRYQLLLRKDV